MTTEEFKSNVLNTALIRLLGSAMILLIFFAVSFIFDCTEYLLNLNSWVIIVLIIICIGLFIWRLFSVNNDLIISNSQVKIHSSLFNGVRNRTFEKDDILLIIFKEQWQESFMANYSCSLLRSITRELVSFFVSSDYKWIEVVTKNNQSHRYYFFGMDYEWYDNYDEILFEDMFLTLARSGVTVKWRWSENEYFKSIQEQADTILSSKKV